MSHTVRPFFFVSECLPVFLGAFNCDTFARSTASLNLIVLLATLNTRFTPRRGTPSARWLAPSYGVVSRIMSGMGEPTLKRDTTLKGQEKIRGAPIGSWLLCIFCGCFVCSAPRSERAEFFFE